ncbi:MAG: hypothetical protein LBS86_03535 [Treponema sp.]|jgi:hypothetical protein|nr:hypothetical protein [Treponema sp.]
MQLFKKTAPLDAVQDRYEGDHILARLEKGHWISIRNKDNICSATIARNPHRQGAPEAWRRFLLEAHTGDSFDTAVDFFERHGITMNVSG